MKEITSSIGSKAYEIFMFNHFFHVFVVGSSICFVCMDMQYS